MAILASNISDEVAENIKKTNPFLPFNFSFLILGGFVIALGVGAVAISLALLSGVTCVISAGAGLSSTLFGIGLFSVGCGFDDEQPDADVASMQR